MNFFTKTVALEQKIERQSREKNNKLVVARERIDQIDRTRQKLSILIPIRNYLLTAFLSTTSNITNHGCYNDLLFQYIAFVDP